MPQRMRSPTEGHANFYLETDDKMIRRMLNLQCLSALDRTLSKCKGVTRFTSDSHRQWQTSSPKPRKATKPEKSLGQRNWTSVGSPAARLRPPVWLK